MRVTWLLPYSHAILSVHNHAEAFDCSLQGGGLERCGKPWQDMAFILIVPSLVIGCKWALGLSAVWTHPCQVCLPTLAEMAQKMMLLASKGTNWPCAYARMNDAMGYMLLSSEGHIGMMTGGYPVGMPMATWTNYGCGVYYNVQAWWFAWGAGWELKTSTVWLQGTTTLECGQCKLTYLRSTHDGCGPEWHGTQGFPLHQSRRSTWPKPQGSTGAAMGSFPSCLQFFLTIHHFQGTTTISSPGNSSPYWRNRKFS